MQHKVHYNLLPPEKAQVMNFGVFFHVVINFLAEKFKLILSVKLSPLMLRPPIHIDKDAWNWYCSAFTNLKLLGLTEYQLIF